jgi:hypothetical protein
MKTFCLMLFAALTLTGCAGHYDKFVTDDGNVYYRPKTNVLAKIDTLRAWNRASAPVNPYATPVDLLLGGAVLGLSWLARIKTNLANRHREDAETLAQGIENAGPDSEPVKKSVQAVARAKKIGARVDALVQTATK